ncbi:MAG: YjgP/YjgQ family permease [Arcobacter sp.]|nr:YjgP/YjgQ family permease [Arcobacter sp.]
MKLKQYLFNQLSQTFFPIFLGLYFITSIIYLVKIAALTSIITMNILELFQLYMYVIPTILFYTAPISFFISLVITLAKLSSEYELIVITTFGLNPFKILKIFFPITLFLSIALVIVSIGLIPKAQFLNERFLEQKKKEANFNIKASEFGQKFGDWLIYISEEKDNNYNEVKLFKTKDKQDQFIMAKRAILDNDEGNLSFKLFNGKSFHINDKEFNQIDYKNMNINDTISKINNQQFTTSFEYWSNKIKKNQRIDKLTFYILTSIFPVISLFLVITFGYFNPRYEKNRAVTLCMLSVVIYYVFMKFLTETTLLHSLYLVPIIWIISTYYIFIKSVKQQY